MRVHTCTHSHLDKRQWEQKEALGKASGSSDTQIGVKAAQKSWGALKEPPSWQGHSRVCAISRAGTFVQVLPWYITSAIFTEVSIFLTNEGHHDRMPSSRCEDLSPTPSIFLRVQVSSIKSPYSEVTEAWWYWILSHWPRPHSYGGVYRDYTSDQLK